MVCSALGSSALGSGFAVAARSALRSVPPKLPIGRVWQGGHIFYTAPCSRLHSVGLLVLCNICRLLRSLALALALALYSSSSSALHHDLVHLPPYTYPFAVIHIDIHI